MEWVVQTRRPARSEPRQRLTRDQREVATRLIAGQVDQVTVSGWGFVCRFLEFLEQLKYSARLDLEGLGYSGR